MAEQHGGKINDGLRTSEVFLEVDAQGVKYSL